MNFIRNDNLGSISNWLLAHADREGADSEACDKLAELHSLAVDFAKTGKPAIMHPADRRWLVRVWFGCSITKLVVGSLICASYRWHAVCYRMDGLCFTLGNFTGYRDDKVCLLHMSPCKPSV